jgi:hypothetical protein
VINDPEVFLILLSGSFSILFLLPQKGSKGSIRFLFPGNNFVYNLVQIKIKIISFAKKNAVMSWRQRSLLVITLYFLIPAGALFAQTGIVKGRIYNHKNNEPVPYANIILDGYPNQGAMSDESGNYTILQITPGYYRLVASSVGFKKFTSEDFLVTNSKTTSVDIPLDETVTTLEQVEIRPDVIGRKDESPVSLQTLTIKEIEKSPGSNRDISKVIGTLPGVASTPAFRNDLIVRGGGPSENRYFLDGVEIPYFNHFSTQGASGGPVGIINVDFIREVEFYTAAFPATRGNMLSSLMELKQIEGNKERFSGRVTLGSSDLGLTLNGPITKHSDLIFSVRRSYLQLLFSALKLPFLPTYNDYQFKYKIDLDKKNQLSLISIGALDQFKLNTGLKNPDDFQNYLLHNLPVNNQWSYTVGLVYRHFRKNGYGTWVLSRNMLNNEEYRYQGNVEVPDSLIFNYKSQEIENKFRYEGITDLGSWKLSYGAGMEYERYNNKTYQKIFLQKAVRILDYSSDVDFFKWQVNGQVTKSFFADKLVLSLGVRMDANSYSTRMSNLLDQFSPRFSASYSLTKKWFINANVGRYFQLPAYTILGFRGNNGMLVNDSLGIRYIACDHAVLGLEFLPRANSKISVEGFYKSYQRYPFSLHDSVSLASKGADYGIYGNEPVVPTSDGRAYGVEVLFRDANIFGFNIILSYTYVRSEFTNAFGSYIPSAWDNRNLLNIQLGYKFRHNWELGAKWRFVGGAPYTPYNMNKSSLVAAWDVQGQGYLDYSKYNTLRLRAFNQLDLRVDKGFYFRKWSLMLYLDIQNLLNFKAQQPDILVNTQPDGSIIKYVDGSGQERYVLRSLSNTIGTFLPSVGIMVDF